MGCDVHGAGRGKPGADYPGAVLIAILVLIITTQLVRNFPALLELALLQHLDLTPARDMRLPPSPNT